MKKLLFIVLLLGSMPVMNINAMCPNQCTQSRNSMIITVFADWSEYVEEADDAIKAFKFPGVTLISKKETRENWSTKNKYYLSFKNTEQADTVLKAFTDYISKFGFPWEIQISADISDTALDRYIDWNPEFTMTSYEIYQ